MEKHIYFDWSGTLAFPKTRHELAKGNINVLYNDTIDLLKYLYKNKYIIGIISNTKMDRQKFITGLAKIDILKYFNGKIILSSDPGMCRKSCNKIFQSINPQGLIYYVGNNYTKDIIGALNNNFIGIYKQTKDIETNLQFYNNVIIIKHLAELQTIL
jgi:FMN phosphatase YigB (HAD superfamily)